MHIHYTVMLPLEKRDSTNIYVWVWLNLGTHFDCVVDYTTYITLVPPHLQLFKMCGLKSVFIKLFPIDTYMLDNITRRYINSFPRLMP